MNSLTTIAQLAFIPPFATRLNAKMVEAQRGGYALDADDRSAIAEEIGRMNRHEWMAMWEGISPTSLDRQRLIGLVCASCTPDVAANIIQDWMMAAAVEIAQGRLTRQEAARIQATEANLALAARAANEAEAELIAARADRAEALELLAQASEIRNAAADQQEIAMLRRCLQDANSRLDAIQSALSR